MTTARSVWLLVCGMLLQPAAPAFAQSRTAASRPSAPTAGARARAPSFWSPVESQGVPITKEQTGACDGDDCRITVRVGGGVIQPQLWTLFNPAGSKRAIVWTIDCRSSSSSLDKMPEKTWSPRPKEIFQPLDADALALLPRREAYRLWFQSMVTAKEGVTSQCFLVKFPP